MARLRPVLALALLAVLTVGGTVAPVVHRVVHAEETARNRAHHAAAQHHHHADASTHGVEAVPPCPEPLASHLACVLCTSALAAVAAAAVAKALPPEASGTVGARDAHAPLAETWDSSSARGPPAVA